MLHTKNVIMHEEIECVDDFKIIGMIMNTHIKWASHTESTANEISKYIGVTNRLKHNLPLHILLYTIL